jgi:hypothetical protein
MTSLRWNIWQLAFWIIALAYAVVYSSFGLNDTDSGFITGLAWEVLHGKVLYKDLSYVRPPLPVWLRSLELYLLPDSLEIRAERWAFYLKMAITAACSARLFAKGNLRWQLALLTFIVSVHSYPPASWHTVDGVLFASIGLYFVQKNRNWAIPLVALAALFSELSKQVFLITPCVLAAWLLFSGRYRQLFFAVLCYAFGKFLFLALLHYQGALSLYRQMTSGATDTAALWQHGVYDFFDMPWLFWVFLAGFVCFQALDYYECTLRLSSQFKQRIYVGKLALTITIFAVLVVSLLAQTYNRQAFTAPFAQTRLLWWIGLISLIVLCIRNNNRQEVLALGACTAINWASAVSWGYNLPVFLPVAGVYGLWRFTLKSDSMLKSDLTLNSSPAERDLAPRLGWWYGLKRWLFFLLNEKNKTQSQESNLAPFPLERAGGEVYLTFIIITLLCSFHYGYQFIYRDGKRSEMHYHLGEIYPKLQGIYSDSDTYLKYRSLQEMFKKYPDATVLPTMTLANYLQNRQGNLPLQWVVEREFGFVSWSHWLEQSRGAVFLVEHHLLEAMASNKQYLFAQTVLSGSVVLEDGEYFRVVRFGGE